MSNERIEYRFVLKAFTPESIPMARLAEYLGYLAALYGEQSAVHFVRLEPSSTAVVSAIEYEADPKVTDRLQAAALPDPASDVRRAYEALNEKVAEDNGTAYVERAGGAKILQFPGRRQVDLADLVYGPFWQPGHLTGSVFRIGGKNDPVSVQLEDSQGSYSCKAKKGLAKQLFAHMWGSPIRVDGKGKWLRDVDGHWQLLQFDIEDFHPLDDESLADTITTLRAISGKWKERHDPIAELDAIRYGNGSQK